MYSLLYSNFAEIRFCFDIAIVTENMAQLGNYLIRDNLLRTWQKFIFNIRLIKIKKQLLFQASFFYNKKGFYNKCWGLEEIEISTFIFFEKKKHICMKSSKIK